MQITWDIHTRLQGIAEEWDQLLPTDHPMRSQELLLAEDARLPRLSYYYVVARIGGKPVLLVYFQHLQVTPEHFNCRDRFFQHHSLNIALRTVKPTLLVAGNLFRHDATYYRFAPLPDAAPEPAEIFRLTVEEVLNRSGASGIFLKDITAECALRMDRDPNYHRMQEDVSMVLHVPEAWQSMADYEKALKHKYLQRYRKTRKQLDGIEIRELDRSEVEQRSAEIEALYLQVTNRQLVSMGKLNRRFFCAMKEQLGDRYRVFGWFLDGRMVAFSSAILHDGVYDMNYIGFDYGVNASHGIYFNILFHCLEQAILTRSASLVLGRTALEAKAILGCTPEYQHSFYRLRHVVVNWFFQRVSAGFREQIGQKWKDRHPFKSGFYAASPETGPLQYHEQELSS